MKLAFVADSQVDEHSRLAEHDRVMEFVVADADERGCSMLLHGGDVTERRSTERERQSVRAWVHEAATAMDVAIVAGNHEAEGEVEEIGATAPDRSRVFATETPCVRIFPAAVIAFLPWPRRAHLARWIESMGAVPSPEQTDLAAAELLRQVLRGLGAQLAAAPPHLPRILLAHVELSGARTDPDQPAMVGPGMKLSLEDLALAGADVVLLGHIHMRQEWMIHRDDGVEVPVIYAGSPRRTAYAKGELVEKGYCCLEFDGRRLVRWERVPTPATPMILHEATFDGSELDFGDTPAGEMPPGAELRLRYSVRPDERDAARLAAEAVASEWMAKGALDVKVEEVLLSETRARAPEVAAASSLPEKLRALWASRREEIEEERAARVIGRLGELEGVTS